MKPQIIDYSIQIHSSNRKLLDVDFIGGDTINISTAIWEIINNNVINLGSGYGSSLSDTSHIFVTLTYKNDNETVITIPHLQFVIEYLAEESS